MDLGLTDKAVVVTGASAGIGAGIARAFAAEGARVVICARRSEPLEAMAADIAAATEATVIPIVAGETFIAAAQARLGRIDVLVNNAGAAPMKPFVDMPDAEFVAALEGKLLATVRCCRAAIPHLRAAGGGVILNITGATLQGVPLHAAGGSANAAIRMFSKVLSQELAPDRIRVNSIGPGRIRTERVAHTFAAEALASGRSPQAVEAATVAGIPVGRLGEPDDIGSLACYLASDLAGYINGAAVPVDGGKAPLI